MARVVHFEIPTDEPQRAIDFYSKTFGWKFDVWKGPQEYWHISTGSSGEPGIDGGLVRRQPDSGDAGSVMAYVCTVDVADIDAALTSVFRNGGMQVGTRTAIPSVGWLAYARDPEGNIFGLMQQDRTVMFI